MTETSKKNVHNLIIIGSGPAGLTAGIYAGRAFLKPLILEGPTPGGQLIGTSLVENWPGQVSIMGATLMMDMKEHARHFGATFLHEQVISADFSKKPFTLVTNKQELKAHSIIIAAGASPNKLNCPGEEQYWGRGVTTCAVCDGAFYPNKQVLIVGGGDTAMEQASFMSKYTNKITIVHLLDKLTASPAMQKRVIENPDIRIIYSSTVTEIQGTGQQVTDVLVTHKFTGETTVIPTDVVFLAIGQKPNTSAYKDQLELDTMGYIKLTEHTHTSVPGVFVAGDVADYRYRQAIVSAGSGCMAALDAQNYLEKN